MRILLLLGSHRRDGNTARALGLLAEELGRLGERHGRAVEAETVFLGELDLRPCRGCRACFDRGEEACPLRDGLLPLYRRLLAADGVVLASPVYVNDVSGTMKTLLDRLAFVCHRPAFARLQLLALATTGGSPTRHTLRTLQGAWLSMGGRVAASLGLAAGALTARGEIARQHGRQLAGAARRLFGSIAGRSHERPAFVNLMMFRIQQASWSRDDPDRVDYRYWDGNGWFDPRCSFFIPHRAPLLRALAARAVGGLLARIFAG